MAFLAAEAAEGGARWRSHADCHGHRQAGVSRVWQWEVVLGCAMDPCKIKPMVHERQDLAARQRPCRLLVTLAYWACPSKHLPMLVDPPQARGHQLPVFPMRPRSDKITAGLPATGDHPSQGPPHCPGAWPVRLK